MYQPRFYREWVRGRLNSYSLTYKETDLLIQAAGFNREQCFQRVRKLRSQLDSFIEGHPDFLTSLRPLSRPADPETFPVPVIKMIEASRQTGVGPMAGVAGLFAEEAGKAVLESTREVIVENGGDIFLDLKKPAVIGFYAGDDSPFTGNIGVKIDPWQTPAGVCTSAGTIGPSYSSGRADAAMVIGDSAVMADAAATALGNMVSDDSDIEKALDRGRQFPGISGIIIALGSRIGTWGQLDLVKTDTD